MSAPFAGGIRQRPRFVDSALIGQNLNISSKRRLRSVGTQFVSPPSPFRNGVNDGVSRGKNREKRAIIHAYCSYAGPKAVDLVRCRALPSTPRRRRLDRSGEGRHPQRPRLRLPRGQRGVTSAMTVEFDPARRDLDIVTGCSEMGLKVRWSFMAPLAVAIAALAGCAATGPLAGDPCWGFFACTGWHDRKIRSHRFWLTSPDRRASAAKRFAEQSSRNLTADGMARTPAPT